MSLVTSTTAHISPLAAKLALTTALIVVMTGCLQLADRSQPTPETSEAPVDTQVWRSRQLGVMGTTLEIQAGGHDANLLDLAIQAAVEEIKVSEPLVDYIQRLIAFTRQGNEFAFGLSPRGALALLKSAKAWALLHHRTHVVPEDVQAVLPSVVEHRLRESADFTGHGGGALAQRLLGSVDVVS